MAGAARAGASPVDRRRPGSPSPGAVVAAATHPPATSRGPARTSNDQEPCPAVPSLGQPFPNCRRHSSRRPHRTNTLPLLHLLIRSAVRPIVIDPSSGVTPGASPRTGRRSTTSGTASPRGPIYFRFCGNGSRRSSWSGPTAGMRADWSPGPAAGRTSAQLSATMVSSSTASTSRNRLRGCSPFPGTATGRQQGRPQETRVTGLRVERKAHPHHRPTCGTSGRARRVREAR
jgi:hypothetical protein